MIVTATSKYTILRIVAQVGIRQGGGGGGGGRAMEKRIMFRKIILYRNVKP